MMAPADAARRGQLLVAAAAVVWSSAGPVQRAVHATAPTQVAVRAGVAMFALTTYLLARRRGGIFAAFRSVGRDGIVVAALLAIISCCFLLALDHTSVARVLLWQAISPFLAALLAWAVMREPIPAAHLDGDVRGARGRGHHGRRLARARPACAATRSAS